MASSAILALDVGEVRIGVALADAELRFPNPLTTLDNNAKVWEKLGKLIDDNEVKTVVIGLPRGLDGQETAQTQSTRSFIAEFRANFTVPIETQDEALTSVKAEAELEARGKPYKKTDVDALAATYILEDYLQVGGTPNA